MRTVQTITTSHHKFSVQFPPTLLRSLGRLLANANLRNPNLRVLPKIRQSLKQNLDKKNRNLPLVFTGSILDTKRHIDRTRGTTFQRDSMECKIMDMPPLEQRITPSFKALGKHRQQISTIRMKILHQPLLVVRAVVLLPNKI